MKPKLLILDDEKNITFVLKAMLDKAGFDADVFNDPVAALKAMQSTTGYSTVITDLYMPKLSGMDVLAEISRSHPGLPVIMITAFGTVETAVGALKNGAFDYVTKPFEQSDILAIVEKAVQTYALRSREPLALSSETELPQSIIVGRSPQMQEVLRVISKIANSPSTILITGESGTGKELVALEVHRNSDRSSKPFIKINCAAIPQNLIESELFGYEKGAYTGAVNSKPGRFELAHEGTLFLDEVADMPPEMQVKLLRAIQESEFERVGGLQTIKIDVRIIAATNKDIHKEVKEGRFREDLFYRLNVVPIHLPPLRERREDLEHLVFFFIRKFNTKLQKQIEGIEPACMKALLKFQWPGNIRQLENVLERTSLMSEGNILRFADLPSEIAANASMVGDASIEKMLANYHSSFESGEPFKDVVKRQTQSVEREIIQKALNQNDGNVTKTAERLGLSRKGLQLKLKELGITPRSS